MHYIYKITNLSNGKQYIGQTNNHELRWSQHRSAAKYGNMTQVVTRALIKYGIDKFTFNVIASCQDQDSANKLEEELIVQYDSRNPMLGYNVDSGGGVSPRPQEVLDKMSAGLKKYYETHDGVFKGKKHTQESKDLMSQVAMGKDGTNTGKTFDDEWRVKIAKAQSGKERKSARKFNDEQESEICRMYIEDEKSTYALAQLFKVNGSLIISILDRNKIIRRQSNYTGHSNGCNRFTLEQELGICADYMTGKVSRVDLAKKYECGKTTIRDILLRNNIKL